MTVRTALITGASRGIGLASAERLARHGYSLTIAARDATRLEAVVDDLVRAGAPEVLALTADMADESAVDDLVAGHAERFGSMNVLLLNAGVGTAGSIESYPMSRFDKTFDVNVRAPFALVQRSIPLLRKGAASDPERGSRVIALSSITGVYAESNLAAYGASKAALLALVDAINVEESATGITASALAPAFVDTDMAAWAHAEVPADRMLPVGDVADVVETIFLLSSRSIITEIVIGRAGTSGLHA